MMSLPQQWSCLVNCMVKCSTAVAHLGCADVAGGLVSPDVLLARLHGHAQRRLAARIAADACSIRKTVSTECLPAAIDYQKRVLEKEGSTATSTLEQLDCDAVRDWQSMAVLLA